MKILLATFLYSFASLEKTKTYLCSNTNETCCSDFKLVNGVCQRCVGSWGLDCNNTCPDGYYGFGCRSKCDCKNEEICHKENGCIQNYTESRSFPIFGIAASASGFLGWLCLIITCCVLWKRKTNNTGNRTNVDTNNDMVNDDAAESIYSRGRALGSHIAHVSNDNQWSPFYDVISETCSSVCKSDVSESDTDSTRKYVTMVSTSEGNCISDPSHNEPYGTCSNKKHFSPGAHSVSLYGICRESVDKYDHLNFKRARTLPQTESQSFPMGKKESKISTKETILTNSSDICNILDNGYSHIDYNRNTPGVMIADYTTL